MMSSVFIESGGRKRLVRLAVWVAVASLVLAMASSLLTALSASAHTALRSMTPAAGSTVTSAPTQVVLQFTEPVSTSFATVTVTGADGSPVSSGRPRVSGSVVTQPLAGVRSGSYTVAFRVVSQDGHPVSDTARFTVELVATSSAARGAGGATAPSTARTATPTAATPSAGPSSAASTGSGRDTSTSLVLLWGVLAALAAVGGTVAAALRDRRSRHR